MDFLIDGLKYAIVAMIFLALARLVWRRYQHYTMSDSNAPGGRRTDWRGFWGRRR